MLALYSLGDGAVRRFEMGACAFLLLQAAELGLGVALGRTPAEHFASFATSAGAIGLAAQMGFGAMPLIVGRRLIGVKRSAE